MFSKRLYTINSINIILSDIEQEGTIVFLIMIWKLDNEENWAEGGGGTKKQFIQNVVVEETYMMDLQKDKCVGSSSN